MTGFSWKFYEKHEGLVALLATFGFREIYRATDGQATLSKPMRPDVDPEPLLGLEYNCRYGPSSVDWRLPAYLVPIQPRYERILFPDNPAQTLQPELFAGSDPFGNSIRKAYLSHSPIKALEPGSLLLF